jgi:hypothetical protein
MKRRFGCGIAWSQPSIPLEGTFIHFDSSDQKRRDINDPHHFSGSVFHRPRGIGCCIDRFLQVVAK